MSQAEEQFLTGLDLTTRFICPANVTAYTLAKMSGNMTLATVVAGDDESLVVAAFMTGRKQNSNAGIQVATRTGSLIPLLSDGADALSPGDLVTVSPTTDGYVGLAASGGIGKVANAAPAVAGSLVLVFF